MDTSKWLSIDCGNDQVSSDDLLLWEPDSDYIQVGSNKLVLTKAFRDEFNTLRAFPSNARNNCYTVPTEKQMLRYIIRVGFYYGNYDGLRKPPTFNLFLNNILWTTVNTSINNFEPFYKETIYPNKELGFFKICLVQIKDGGIPFIRSIETMVIFDELYPKMETNAIYSLITRINFGGPVVWYNVGSGEIYKWIWIKKVMPYASAFWYKEKKPVDLPQDVVSKAAEKQHC
ncbi:putative LRR receptor-like serine/threonine-protein kinase At1g05700 [Apium graveolens]|uniref:putative LRR receptor-like serine/threonine-protein kinase At1g05700 n=1 Tax=Apium graveolens TaxID=4045 RepID=UPI003D7AB578